MMRIKILKRELLKPSIPTPPNLKTYKLAYIDELLPLMEVGVLLLYKSKPKTLNLKESLVKVLPSFYPLAGRFIIDNLIVDCSDQGAEFLEALAPDAEISTLAEERNFQNLTGFLPRKNRSEVDLATYPILSIQITKLKCGGVVIGINIPHKIFDVSSMTTFIAAWSNASSRGPDTAMNPSHDTSSWFPSKNKESNSKTLRFVDFNEVAVKRFSFTKEAIANTRQNKAISKGRVVSALIARALILVDRKKNGGQSRDCLITQAVDMRERTVPPLHKHACGNLPLLSLARYAGSENDPAVLRPADLLVDATSRSIAACAHLLSLDEHRRNETLMTPLRNVSTTFLSGQANVITFSDCSKFELYGMDFGWGKPVSAAIAPLVGANTVILIGNRDGDGIEAWVQLLKNDMRLFEEIHGCGRFFLSSL